MSDKNNKKIVADIHLVSGVSGETEQHGKGYASVIGNEINIFYKNLKIDLLTVEDITEYNIGNRHGLSFSHKGTDIFFESNGHTKYLLEILDKYRQNTPELDDVLAAA